MVYGLVAFIGMIKNHVFRSKKPLFGLSKHIELALVTYIVMLVTHIVTFITCNVTMKNTIFLLI